jgi:streptogramin lyase
MKMRTPMLALAGALTTALAFPASGMAVTGTVTEFQAGLGPNAAPYDIALGPDGNVWFTDQDPDGSKIGRVTPSGAITEFATKDANSSPTGISLGPDGKLWYVESAVNSVVRVDNIVNPAATGGQQAFNFGGILSSANGIATGPDNNLWVVSSGNDKLVRLNAAGGHVGTDVTVGSGPRNVTLGPDGNMWVTEFGVGGVGRVTPGGTFDNFPTAVAWDITSGSDGNLWFTSPSGATNFVGRMTTAGVGTPFMLPSGADPSGIAVGMDGNVWFTEFMGEMKIGQVTPSGAIMPFGGLTAGAGPRFIAKGSDGNMWFTELLGHRIGRITVDAPAPPRDGGGNGGGGGGGGTTNGTTPTTPVNNAGTPQVSEVAVKPSRFRVGARATAVSAAAKAKTGTTIAFVLTKDATATLSFQQALQGRKRGSNCVRINRRNRNGRKCTRFVPRGRLTRNSLQGQNAVPFTGRIGHRALKPGHYRVGVAGTDAEGRSGLFQYATFVVLPPKQKAARRGR